MKLTYITAESTVRPQELEVGITTVYFRRNIVETQRTDDMFGGHPITMYVYEEAKLSKDEALLYFAEAQIDAQAELENALCEQDAVNEERFATIEDALCELDKQ